MTMIIPPLKLKVLLESKPLKSRILVWILAVSLFCKRAGRKSKSDPESLCRVVSDLRDTGTRHPFEQ